MIVRDPVVLAGTLPRFLSVGDQSRFFMQLDNVEGPAGDYTVDLDIHGPVVVPADALRRTVRLEAGGKGSVTIPVTAAGPGHGDVRRQAVRAGRRGDAELRLAPPARHVGRSCAAPCGRSRRAPA